MNETEHGEGASNAAGHTEGKAPGEAPVRLTYLGEIPSPKLFYSSLLACLRFICLSAGYEWVLIWKVYV